MASRVVSLVGLMLFVFRTMDSSFEVFWNVPSDMCSVKFGVNITQALLKYNILVNDKESFIGDKISLIYEDKIGKYPHVDSKMGDVNGGLPTLDNLDEHLKLAEEDIQKIIPNPNFNGLGVIDWEAWRPTWEFLWGNLQVYKVRTIEMVKKDHPNLSDQIIENKAKTLWEESARQWMLKTLELAKKLRSEGRWCYYLFPDCYNYFGKEEPSEFECSARIKSNNDRLSWMWDSSTALCPSIYFIENQIAYNESQRIWFLYYKLAEAIRVSRGHTPIYPYINFMVHLSRTFVPKGHFERMLSLIASLGLDGAVIWGSSSYFENKQGCENLRDYIETIIGPTVRTVSHNVECCGRLYCNGRGRCVWPNEPFVSWKYLLDSNLCRLDNLHEAKCRCQTGENQFCL